jgi:hypothetical protein
MKPELGQAGERKSLALEGRFSLRYDRRPATEEDFRMNAGNRMRSTLAHACAVALLAAAPAAFAADGTAKGTVVYKSKGETITANIKHVWLVKGPDAIDPKTTIRRLIFSATDIGAKVKACKNMGCTTNDLGEGMTVDLDIPPRLNYWIVLKGQRVQYSGTVVPEALKASTNTPARLAGKLTIDSSGAGGGKVDIDFDTPLTAELKTAR